MFIRQLHVYLKHQYALSKFRSKNNCSDVYNCKIVVRNLTYQQKTKMIGLTAPCGLKMEYSTFTSIVKLFKELNNLMVWYDTWMYKLNYY